MRNLIDKDDILHPEHVTQRLNTKRYPDMFLYAVQKKRDDAVLDIDGYNLKDMNLSSLWTRLIQDTGRFAERFASDLLFNIDQIEEILSFRPIDGPEHHLVMIGIRRDGVDGNAFVESRILDNYHGKPLPMVSVDHIYRKLYCVDIEISPNTDTAFHVRLIDLTDILFYPTKEDIEHHNNPG